MELILWKENKEGRADYRDSICGMCGEECNPRYRFNYSSKECDKKGNPLIDGEVECCSKCYSKLNEMFKN